MHVLIFNFVVFVVVVVVVLALVFLHVLQYFRSCSYSLDCEPGCEQSLSIPRNQSRKHKNRAANLK